SDRGLFFEENDPALINLGQLPGHRQAGDAGTENDNSLGASNHVSMRALCPSPEICGSHGCRLQITLATLAWTAVLDPVRFPYGGRRVADEHAVNGSCAASAA